MRKCKPAFVLGALTTGAVSSGKHQRVCMPTGMDIELIVHVAFNE